MSLSRGVLVGTGWDLSDKSNRSDGDYTISIASP